MPNEIYRLTQNTAAICVTELFFYGVSLADQRASHNDRQRDLAVPEVRTRWLCGDVHLLAHCTAAHRHHLCLLLPAHHLPHRPHVLLLKTRLPSVRGAAHLFLPLFICMSVHADS